MPSLDPYFATDTALPLSVIVMRLLIAMLCGGAIGFERERKNRAAGLRTHILVCLSSAIVAILTIEIAHHSAFQADSVRIDPLRLIEAITAGVAFLAAGLGFWHISLLATTLALIVLWLLHGLERRVVSRPETD